MVAKTLDDFVPMGKKVVLRADLNMPAQNGKISDTWD
jgi:3-phosphoglycerate kinase